LYPCIQKRGHFMGWKALFKPSAVFKHSFMLFLLVMVAIFVPTWILLVMCITVGGLFRQWYKDAGYWLIVGMVLFGLILPLGLQWAYDVWGIQGLLDIYNMIKPVTPQPPLIPLFTVTLSPVFSITPNLDMIYIITAFTMMVFVGFFIVRFNYTKRGVYMFTSGVAGFYGVLVGVSWFSWLTYTFSVGQIDISSMLFNWSQFVLVYHLVFHFIPLLVIYVGLLKLNQKLGVMQL